MKPPRQVWRTFVQNVAWFALIVAVVVVVLVMLGGK